MLRDPGDSAYAGCSKLRRSLHGMLVHVLTDGERPEADDIVRLNRNTCHTGVW